MRPVKNIVLAKPLAIGLKLKAYNYSQEKGYPAKYNPTVYHSQLIKKHLIFRHFEL